MRTTCTSPVPSRAQSTPLLKFKKKTTKQLTRLAVCFLLERRRGERRASGLFLPLGPKRLHVQGHHGLEPKRMAGWRFGEMSWPWKGPAEERPSLGKKGHEEESQAAKPQNAECSRRCLAAHFCPRAPRALLAHLAHRLALIRRPA